MLTYWIPDGPCMIPGNATHHVGVGGFVINDNNEVALHIVATTVFKLVCWLKIINLILVNISDSCSTGKVL